VAEEIVAVPEADDAEVGGVAEDARGGEAGVGGVVDRGGRAEVAKAVSFRQACVRPLESGFLLVKKAAD
jgi:hypothetical protein